MAGDAATPEQIAQIRQQYGLDQPIWEQFLVYTGKAVAARLRRERVLAPRRSRSTSRSGCRRRWSSPSPRWRCRSCSACRWASFAALKHNHWPDFLLRIFSVMGIAVAAFWFAIMLQLLFAMQLGLAAAARRARSDADAPPAGSRGFLLLDSVLAGRWDAFRRRAAPSGAAGGHPGAGRAGHHRALHPRRACWTRCSRISCSTSAPWATAARG